MMEIEMDRVERREIDKEKKSEKKTKPQKCGDVGIRFRYLHTYLSSPMSLV